MVLMYVYRLEKVHCTCWETWTQNLAKILWHFFQKLYHS